ncbi:hypothetical protein V6N11_003666 [Hibiscus sabdariffa]|uniref:Uncharacterized protein n=1 Tax=Hibiscus sabdariffa TaxID=183260 RepID=A0ABR2SDY5_9ROSI
MAKEVDDGEEGREKVPICIKWPSEWANGEACYARQYCSSASSFDEYGSNIIIHPPAKNSTKLKENKIYKLTGYCLVPKHVPRNKDRALFSFCLASERRSYLNWDWERSWNPIKERELRGNEGRESDASSWARDA